MLNFYLRNMCANKKMKWLFITILGASIFHSTQAATLRFYNGSLTNFYEVPLKSPLPALTSTYVNTTRPTVIYAFGYIQHPDSTDVETILRAYLANVKDKNLVLLNWEDEASNGRIGDYLGYTIYAVPNAKTVGENLGNAITALIKDGLNADVHLVGHSLGAQLMGFAGAQAKNNGQLLPRITGLDPAGPVYDLPLAEHLDPSDAVFVDVIHTNPSLIKYGSTKNLGTVDIWLNYHTKSGLQPECPTGFKTPFSKEDLCSHQRSVLYFSESLGSPKAFAAAGATNYNSWYNGHTTDVVIYIGEDIDTQASGNFYLSTNGQTPYGKGQDGLKPSSDDTA